jgi:kojibiose phosphorylase
MDVVIEGDRADQVALRFSAYHNRICTPAHTDRLPIGARGLSCQAYQGSAFWDQEIYNLPAFLFTEPEIARSILVYRHRTLDGARRKAARLGYAGAYYAWISGLSGDELCPDYFFEDVLTGRPIRNHFNIWQMHVAPDIVTTVARYVEVTGDERFLVDHGAEIAFEVARFLWSFVRYDEWRGVYHCIRLLGPDEWHENVDDNAFTNYQVRAALAFAVDTYEALVERYPEELAALAQSLRLDSAEVDGWRRVCDRMLLPQPHPENGLIEQFAGFFDLEDVTPEQVEQRLLDPNEYWGWPNGVAVATQVSKQADVAVLLWQHPELFDDSVARSNYDYYEPRCSHNSSLSHAVYGFVAARIGELAAAHQHFVKTATVDILNTNHAVVGGTFIGGIHTAACGGTYQLAVQGFGGLGFSSGCLTMDPRLPRNWKSISYPVVWRGNRLRVKASRDRVVITAEPDNSPVVIRVRGVSIEIPPGAEISV